MKLLTMAIAADFDFVEGRNSLGMDAMLTLPDEARDGGVPHPAYRHLNDLLALNNKM
jgi:hypothetical protein